MTHTAPLQIERRSEKRIPGHYDLSGCLKTADTQTLVRSILIDVSTIGIGIRSLDYLQPESTVLISLKEEKVYFRVAWAKADSANKSLWHIGLLIEDPSMDLSSWFERHGIVVSQKKAKSEGHSRSLSEVNWSDLRPLIAMAHISEAGFSKQPGMEKLMTDRKAYPINFNGISLMAVLPKDLKPLRINEITDSEAELKIKILRRVRTGLGDSRWVLIWPQSGL